MNSFRLKVSTPNGNVFDSLITEIILRGTEGELAVLANHIPFMTTVLPCVCKIILGDERELKAKTDGGILTVAKECTTLLCGSFEEN